MFKDSLQSFRYILMRHLSVTFLFLLDCRHALKLTFTALNCFLNVSKVTISTGEKRHPCLALVAFCPNNPSVLWTSAEAIYINLRVLLFSCCHICFSIKSCELRGGWNATPYMYIGGFTRCQPSDLDPELRMKAGLSNALLEWWIYTLQLDQWDHFQEGELMDRFQLLSQVHFITETRNI